VQEAAGNLTEEDALLLLQALLRRSAAGGEIEKRTNLVKMLLLL